MQQQHAVRSSRRQLHLSDHMAAAIELSTSPNVPPAPAAGMYWSRAISFGRGPSRPLRAHTSNLIGEHLYVFGGCDIKACFNTLYILDMGNYYIYRIGCGIGKESENSKKNYFIFHAL